MTDTFFSFTEWNLLGNKKNSINFSSSLFYHPKLEISLWVGQKPQGIGNWEQSACDIKTRAQVYMDLLCNLMFKLFIFPYFRMQERQVKEQQIEYAKKILKIQEQLKTSLAQVQYVYLVQLVNLCLTVNQFLRSFEN